MILEQYLIKSRKKENNMEQIITSLLETDAYKLSMGQAIYHQFSDYKTTWSFKCRNKDVHFTPEMVEEIRRQIKLYCDLRFTEDELTYIDNIKWMKGSYVDFLRLWQPRYEDLRLQQIQIVVFLSKHLVHGLIHLCMRFLHLRL